MSGMNSQIHLFLETDLKSALEREALKEGISFSELCREKLRSKPQLDKIEFILEEIKKKMK